VLTETCFTWSLCCCRHVKMAVNWLK